MPRMLGLAGVALLAVFTAFAGRAPAGFVALANHTDRDLDFTLVHPDGKPIAGKLAAGECRRVAVGRRPEVTYTSAGKPARFRLTPYSAYVFTPDGGGVAVHRVEFAGAMPRADDVPDSPAPVTPFKLRVKLYVDDADVRAQAVWEKVLRERIAAASTILQRQCNVTVEVAGVGDWVAGGEARDLETLLKDFERVVKAGPAIAIGFTSRPLEPMDKEEVRLACSAPLRPHILLHERFPRNEPERVEVLVHQLAHSLGAAHVPDPNSAMRTSLGDGRAIAANFRPGLDPLNVLAVGLWTDAMQAGTVAGWADLPPLAVSRLLIVYRTLQELSPNDPLVNDYVAALDRVRLARAAVKPAAPERLPAVPAPAPALSPVQEAARKIVRTIAIRAADLSRLPPATRPTGDQLTAELVRAAADTAVTLDEPLQAPAFLIGLGIGLDDSSTLRDNLLTKGTCRVIETGNERNERLAVLGSPTLYGRRDLCQHFAVSAALAELLGPAAAETVGLTKELLDRGRDSGFSFADLAADYAGVAFATKVKSDLITIKLIRAEFPVKDYVPAPAGLAEGLNRERFQAEYGGLDDPRFKQAVEAVRKRIAELPAYRK